MTKKILAVINPYSRAGRMDKIIAACEELLAGFDTTFVKTESAQEAVIQAAKGHEFDLVMSIGGDGTAHSVLNGLMQIEREKRPPLAIIPAGSGNDSARMVGVPSDIAQSIAIALSGEARLYDIGQFNDGYFLNSCSMGIDARINAKAIEYKPRFKVQGLLLYGSALLKVIATDPSPLNVMIQRNDDEWQQHKVLLGGAINATTYGGGIPIAPQGNHSDNKLNFFFIDALSFLGILKRIPALIAKRVHTVPEYHDALIKSAEIRTMNGKPTVCQADGEVYIESVLKIKTMPDEVYIMSPQSETSVLPPSDESKSEN